jgi:hypothetical protein
MTVVSRSECSHLLHSFVAIFQANCRAVLHDLHLCIGFETSGCSVLGQPRAPPFDSFSAPDKLSVAASGLPKTGLSALVTFTSFLDVPNPSLDCLYGFPFDHFQILCPFLLIAAQSFRHHHTPVSTTNILATYKQNNTRKLTTNRFHCRSRCTSTYLPA